MYGFVSEVEGLGFFLIVCLQNYCYFFILRQGFNKFFIESILRV